MSDATDAKTRDRSPSYPALPLGAAVDRLVAFEAHFKRSPAPVAKVGAAWGLKEGNSDADRFLAALRAYGLVDYQVAPSGRQAVISEDGRILLRAQQDAMKRPVLKRAALRPKMIRHFWSQWGNDRPADDACLDQLVLGSKFSDSGARKFLTIYDATTLFAGLSESDKVGASEGDGALDEEISGAGIGSGQAPTPIPLPPAITRSPPRHTTGIALMDGERELTTGLLSKGASFRLIVSGRVGSREIERLIQKLELDKEILADATEDVPVSHDDAE
jgi:hypothetical protein